MKPDDAKPDSPPPPCFAWVSGIWSLFVAMVVGTFAGYNEATALLCFIAVPLTVATWDKWRHCEGRFGSRPYSREDEPGFYWFAKATGVWSAIALLYGAYIAYDLIIRDGSLTGLGPP